jgi:hypothetical protein
VRFAILAISLFMSFATRAQAQVQVPPNCQFQVNPHSYACTQWTFFGNQMFPLNPIDLNFLSGSWSALTFVDPTFENNGPEFVMMVNPQRPTVPVGVLDRFTNAQDGATQTRWRGQVLNSDPGSMRVVDNWTFQFTFSEPPYVHLYSCRDFNRNDVHHLLCSWEILMPGANQWVHKGFLGYLRGNGG